MSLILTVLEFRPRISQMWIAATVLIAVKVFIPVTVNADAGSWYRDGELKVSFYYSSRFEPEDPAELTTRYVVNWRARESGGLIASCYLRAISVAYDDEKGRRYLKENAVQFAQSMREKTLSRARKAEIVEARPMMIDGLQGAYIVMDVETESFDKVYRMRSFSIVSFWKGYEIALECGSTIRDVVSGTLPEDQATAAIKNVEAEMMRSLRTLHFQRH